MKTKKPKPPKCSACGERGCPHDAPMIDLDALEVRARLGHELLKAMHMVDHADARRVSFPVRGGRSHRSQTYYVTITTSFP